MSTVEGHASPTTGQQRQHSESGTDRTFVLADGTNDTFSLASPMTAASPSKARADADEPTGRTSTSNDGRGGAHQANVNGTDVDAEENRANAPAGPPERAPEAENSPDADDRHGGEEARDIEEKKGSLPAAGEVEDDNKSDAAKREIDGKKGSPLAAASDYSDGFDEHDEEPTATTDENPPGADVAPKEQSSEPQGQEKKSSPLAATSDYSDGFDADHADHDSAGSATGLDADRDAEHDGDAKLGKHDGDEKMSPLAATSDYSDTFDQPTDGGGETAVEASAAEGDRKHAATADEYTDDAFDPHTHDDHEGGREDTPRDDHNHHKGGDSNDDCHDDSKEHVSAKQEANAKKGSPLAATSDYSDGFDEHDEHDEHDGHGEHDDGDPPPHDDEPTGATDDVPPTGSAEAAPEESASSPTEPQGQEKKSSPLAATSDYSDGFDEHDDDDARDDETAAPKADEGKDTASLSPADEKKSSPLAVTSDYSDGFDDGDGEAGTPVSNHDSSPQQQTETAAGVPAEKDDASATTTPKAAKADQTGEERPQQEHPSSSGAAQSPAADARHNSSDSSGVKTPASNEPKKEESGEAEKDQRLGADSGSGVKDNDRRTSHFCAPPPSDVEHRRDSTTGDHSEQRDGGDDGEQKQQHLRHGSEQRERTSRAGSHAFFDTTGDDTGDGDAHARPAAGRSRLPSKGPRKSVVSVQDSYAQHMLETREKRRSVGPMSAEEERANDARRRTLNDEAIARVRAASMAIVSESRAVDLFAALERSGTASKGLRAAARRRREKTNTEQRDTKNAVLDANRRDFCAIENRERIVLDESSSSELSFLTRLEYAERLALIARHTSSPKGKKTSRKERERIAAEDLRLGNAGLLAMSYQSDGSTSPRGGGSGPYDSDGGHSAGAGGGDLNTAGQHQLSEKEIEAMTTAAKKYRKRGQPAWVPPSPRITGAPWVEYGEQENKHGQDMIGATLAKLSPRMAAKGMVMSPLASPASTSLTVPGQGSGSYTTNPNTSQQLFLTSRSAAGASTAGDHGTPASHSHSQSHEHSQNHDGHGGEAGEFTLALPPVRGAHGDSASAVITPTTAQNGVSGGDGELVPAESLHPATPQQRLAALVSALTVESKSTSKNPRLVSRNASHSGDELLDSDKRPRSGAASCRAEADDDRKLFWPSEDVQAKLKKAKDREMERRKELAKLQFGSGFVGFDAAAKRRNSDATRSAITAHFAQSPESLSSSTTSHPRQKRTGTASASVDRLVVESDDDERTPGGERTPAGGDATPGASQSHRLGSSLSPSQSPPLSRRVSASTGGLKRKDSSKRVGRRFGTRRGYERAALAEDEQERAWRSTIAQERQRQENIQQQHIDKVANYRQKPDASPRAVAINDTHASRRQRVRDTKAHAKFLAARTDMLQKGFVDAKKKSAARFAQLLKEQEMLVYGVKTGAAEVKAIAREKRKAVSTEESKAKMEAVARRKRELDEELRMRRLSKIVETEEIVAGVELKRKQCAEERERQLDEKHKADAKARREREVFMSAVAEAATERRRLEQLTAQGQTDRLSARIDLINAGQTQLKLALAGWEETTAMARDAHKTRTAADHLTEQRQKEKEQREQEARKQQHRQDIEACYALEEAERKQWSDMRQAEVWEKARHRQAIVKAQAAQKQKLAKDQDLKSAVLCEEAVLLRQRELAEKRDRVLERKIEEERGTVKAQRRLQLKLFSDSTTPTKRSPNPSRSTSKTPSKSGGFTPPPTAPAHHHAQQQSGKPPASRHHVHSAHSDSDAIVGRYETVDVNNDGDGGDRDGDNEFPMPPPSSSQGDGRNVNDLNESISRSPPRDRRDSKEVSFADSTLQHGPDGRTMNRSPAAKSPSLSPQRDGDHTSASGGGGNNATPTQRRDVETPKTRSATPLGPLMGMHRGGGARAQTPSAMSRSGLSTPGTHHLRFPPPRAQTPGGGFDRPATTGAGAGGANYNYNTASRATTPGAGASKHRGQKQPADEPPRLNESYGGSTHQQRHQDQAVAPDINAHHHHSGNQKHRQHQGHQGRDDHQHQEDAFTRRDPHHREHRDGQSAHHRHGKASQSANSVSKRARSGQHGGFSEQPQPQPRPQAREVLPTVRSVLPSAAPTLAYAPSRAQVKRSDASPELKEKAMRLASLLESMREERKREFYGAAYVTPQQQRSQLKAKREAKRSASMCGSEFGSSQQNSGQQSQRLMTPGSRPLSPTTTGGDHHARVAANDETEDHHEDEDPKELDQTLGEVLPPTALQRRADNDDDSDNGNGRGATIGDRNNKSGGVDNNEDGAADGAQGGYDDDFSHDGDGDVAPAHGEKNGPTDPDDGDGYDDDFSDSGEASTKKGTGAHASPDLDGPNTAHADGSGAHAAQSGADDSGDQDQHGEAAREGQQERNRADGKNSAAEPSSAAPGDPNVEAEASFPTATATPHDTQPIDLVRSDTASNPNVGDDFDHDGRHHGLDDETDQLRNKPSKTHTLSADPTLMSSGRGGGTLNDTAYTARSLRSAKSAKSASSVAAMKPIEITIAGDGLGVTVGTTTLDPDEEVALIRRLTRTPLARAAAAGISGQKEPPPAPGTMRARHTAHEKVTGASDVLFQDAAFAEKRRIRALTEIAKRSGGRVVPIDEETYRQVVEGKPPRFEGKSAKEIRQIKAAEEEKKTKKAEKAAARFHDIAVERQQRSRDAAAKRTENDSLVGRRPFPSAKGEFDEDGNIVVGLSPDRESMMVDRLLRPVRREKHLEPPAKKITVSKEDQAGAVVRLYDKSIQHAAHEQQRLAEKYAAGPKVASAKPKAKPAAPN